MTAEQISETVSVCTEKRRCRLFGLPMTLTHYVIDGEWLAECSGLFSVTAKAVSLSHIRNMVVVQSPLEKLWGLSTIHVATADPALPEFVVHSIRGAEVFAAKLQKAIDTASCLRQSVTE